MPRMKKILAPTDFSELSKLGLRYALELARYESAEVIVYHAIDLGADWYKKPVEFGPSPDVLAQSSRLLDKFLAENFADCINLVEVRQMVELGAACTNIVEKAASEGVDLIVMSSHGRTGLNHLIQGSVAEKVVARASCPVLIVPRHTGQGLKSAVEIDDIGTVREAGERKEAVKDHLHWWIECPLTGGLARAEVTAWDSQPGMRFEIAECSFWPEKRDCEQQCVNRPVF